MDLLQYIANNNPPQRWLIALTVAAAVFAFTLAVRRLLIWRFRSRAAATASFFDDAILYGAETTRPWVLCLLGLFGGTLILTLPAALALWARTLLVIALLIQAGLWGSVLIERWVERYGRRNLEADAGRIGTARVLGFVARLVLVSVVVVLALDNIPGVQVTPLLASLGIGGIAVALAVQNILSDLFASLSIALDKPFVTGDVIGVDDMTGSVEQIGVKTTRVRSLSGEQIIFSNADLLGSRIRNFARQQERRVLFTFGVALDTPPAKLRATPAVIRQLVEAEQQTRFDRAHLRSIDASTLTFEVVYFVQTTDYNHFMNVQQEVVLGILEHLAVNEIQPVAPAAVPQPAPPAAPR